MRTLSVRGRRSASRGRDILVLSSACFLGLSGVAQAQEPAPVAAPPAEVAASPTPASAPAAEAPAGPAAPAAPAADAVSVAPVEEAPKPAATKPPPYSLPWQLRPVAPGNVVRLDSSYGFYKSTAPNNDTKGSALVSTLLGSYKVIPDLALIGRVGLVDNSPTRATPQPAHKTDILNPVLGGLYGIKLTPNLKLGLFLGVTLPVGSGGGTNTSLGKKAAIGAGINTRSAFDNAMFAIDWFTVFPGVDLAFVQSGFTLQVEATVFKLTKVRGPATEDDSKVNFTGGIHAGYFVTPFLSLGAELRHQRWLSTPMAVKADKTDSIRDTTTFAVGPRFHFKVSDSSWFRPGVSLSLPIDDPMKKADYTIVQLDLPISF